MAYSIQPAPNVVAGQNEALNGVASAFATPEAANGILVFLNTFLNACIGLLITLTVVALFVYLVLWIGTKENPDARNAAINGAIRSMAALFLMINIWSIFRTFNFLLALSDVTAFLVFLFAFMLLGFWSLFNLGDNFVRLCTTAIEWFIDMLVTRVRELSAHSESLNNRVQQTSQNGLRFFTFAILAIILSAGSFVWWSPPATSQTADQSSAVASEWQPVEYASTDVSLVNGLYQDKALGFSIRFPADWQVTISNADPDTLITGRNGSTTVAVFADEFTGPLSGTSTLLESQIYSVANNTVASLQAGGYGISQYSLYQSGSLGNAPAYELDLEAIDSSTTAYDWNTTYFDSDRTSFALQFLYPNSVSLSSSTIAEMRGIVESIQVSGSHWAWAP